MTLNDKLKKYIYVLWLIIATTIAVIGLFATFMVDVVFFTEFGFDAPTIWYLIVLALTLGIPVLLFLTERYRKKKDSFLSFYPLSIAFLQPSLV